MGKENFRSGFVSIIGKPNVGKSTLMNAMVGEKLSIITSKAQTTRHRIMGMLTSDDFQIIYSDTPGILEPEYELHKSMMKFVNESLEDADLILFVVDLMDKYENEQIIDVLNEIDTPVMLVINKSDLNEGSRLKDKTDYWELIMPDKEIIAVSALNNDNIDVLLKQVMNHIPVHPAYFPEDTLTDKPEKFFAAEIIREKIFENYKQEVPYSTEVEIESFKEEEHIIRMRAEIFVERKTQKGILIGKGGESIKKMGTEARIAMEAFFGKKVFLETFVKVEENWRKSERHLRRFGYKQ
ncbi:GTPase Era [Reichenbachiella sp. MALMAid0571]|uniref:GTPase Era n=1 Tax=Reichenbachiella sp. MALMAid0571 TaxID=3143939 RepID=UPI0032DF5931